MSERNDVATRQESMPERNSEIPVIAPLVDIFENENEILLYADIPGVKKEAVTINVDNGRLELAGIRKMDTSAGVVGWEEFKEVEYQRIFSVPQSIDVGKVNAELRDGVLKVHLPKLEAAKPRTIEITAG